MTLKNTAMNEQHPLLPSGDWVGFYVYNRSKEKHEMIFSLEFKDGKIAGNGSDDVGAFAFNGDYDLETMTCQLMKHYSTHNIHYKGYIDENGIWGKWSYVYNSSLGISEEKYNFLMSLLGDELAGGFHIWPSKRKFSTHEIEKKEAREKKVIEMVQ